MSEPRGSATPRSGVLRRLGAATFALVVVVVGSASRHELSLPLERSAVGRFLGTVGAVVFGVAGVIVIALLAWTAALLARRKRRDPEQQRAEEQRHSRWARIATWLTAIAILLIPAVLVIAARHHGAQQGAATPSRLPLVLREHPVPTVSHATPLALGALLVAVVTAAVVFVAWSRQQREKFPTAEAAPVTPPPAVAEVAESGAAALRDVEDARQAIMACYAAMRAALLRFGIAGHAADTPTEFLQRAASGGVAPASARQLTALFHEARFSAHQMTSAHRRQAEAALQQIARSVGNSEHANIGLSS